MTNDIKMAIDAANKKFSEGFTKSNASITASGFADDAVVFPPDANMIQGKRAIEEFWKAVMAPGVKEVTLNTVELTVSGDYAHERGTGVLKIQPQDGTPTKQNIKYVVYGNARRMAGKTCGTSGIAPLEVYQRSISGVDMSKTIIIIDSSEVNAITHRGSQCPSM